MTPTPTIPFGRILRPGARGDDVAGVNRALRREKGVNDPPDRLAYSAETAGLIREIQRRHDLAIDGLYGPKTHAELTPAFDDYARLLYTGAHGTAYLRLPKTFARTHDTGGLDGFPAVDVFAAPGTETLAPADSKVVKLSGHPPAAGGVRGGAYGWSTYLRSAAGTYFLTHFALRAERVKLGATIWEGQLIGTVADAAVAGMRSSASHIHEGFHKGPLTAAQARELGIDL